jgi:hypothetical protein
MRISQDWQAATVRRTTLLSPSVRELELLPDAACTRPEPGSRPGTAQRGGRGKNDPAAALAFEVRALKAENAALSAALLARGPPPSAGGGGRGEGEAREPRGCLVRASQAKV